MINGLAVAVSHEGVTVMGSGEEGEVEREGEVEGEVGREGGGGWER
jgi:hypothetical protein